MRTIFFVVIIFRPSRCAPVNVACDQLSQSPAALLEVLPKLTGVVVEASLDSSVFNRQLNSLVYITK